MDSHIFWLNPNPTGVAYICYHTFLKVNLSIVRRYDKFAKITNPQAMSPFSFLLEVFFG
jgi:hypothetical protein